MQLLVAHQILIGSAILLCTLFSIRALVLFARAGGYGDLLLALGAAVIGTALAFYFRKLRERWRASRRP